MASKTSEITYLKSLLRSVLISSKDGLPADKLLDTYKEIVGEDLPYQQHGYSSLNAFIQSLPDVVKPKWVNGKLFYEGLPNKETDHIHDLVSKQRVAKRRKRKKKPTRRQAGGQSTGTQTVTLSGPGYDFSVNRKANIDSVVAETKEETTDNIGSSGSNKLGPSLMESDYIPLRDENKDSVVPKTEEEATGYINPRHSRKRPRYMMEPNYVPFRSDCEASNKRIRWDILEGSSNWYRTDFESAFTFHRPSYMYTADHYSHMPYHYRGSYHDWDVDAYRNLVKQDPTTAYKHVCKHFLQPSGCAYDELCLKLHIPGTKLTQPDRDRFQLPRKQCLHFLATGCLRSDLCRYMHVSNHDISCQTREKLKLPPIKPCKFDHENRCWFGATCEWLHKKRGGDKVKDELNDIIVIHDTDSDSDVVKIETLDDRM